MSLDYKGIEALYTVVHLQSFEAAARALHITQSAVSQRIKALESYYGEPTLIRTLPYQLTPLGERLVGHFRRVCLLEDVLLEQLQERTKKPKIAIALNRDSLETFFLEIIENPIFSTLAIEIIADDQELTLDYLKKGLVDACISTSDKAIVGGNAIFLGTMEYYLVASPQFIKNNFKRKQTDPEALLTARAVRFDKNDKLHERYLQTFFGLEGEIDFHTVPSIQGFKKYILLGYGYGLIPKIDILKELKSRQLKQLYPDKIWPIPLYWHYWDIQSPFYEQFNREIIAYIQEKLQ